MICGYHYFRKHPCVNMRCHVVVLLFRHHLMLHFLHLLDVLNPGLSAFAYSGHCCLELLEMFGKRQQYIYIYTYIYIYKHRHIEQFRENPPLLLNHQHTRVPWVHSILDILWVFGWFWNFCLENHWPKPATNKNNNWEILIWLPGSVAFLLRGMSVKQWFVVLTFANYFILFQQNLGDTL